VQFPRYTTILDNMKHARINAVLLAVLCSINASCTTNRVTVDDHSYHHNDTPSGNTIINHHYPQTIVQPSAPPTLQQSDQDFLQYSQVSGSYYEPRKVYPPIVPGGLCYPQTRPFTHTYQVPTYTNYAQAYRVRARVQFGL
jgi:hypothetical protein